MNHKKKLKDSMAAEHAAAVEKAEEMSYIIEENTSTAVGPYVDPSERKPIHHLKENLAMKEVLNHHND